MGVVPGNGASLRTWSTGPHRPCEQHTLRSETDAILVRKTSIDAVEQGAEFRVAGIEAGCRSSDHQFPSHAHDHAHR